MHILRFSHVCFVFFKKCLSSILPRDLEGFDLIIFENLDKSLEYFCYKIAIIQN